MTNEYDIIGGVKIHKKPETLIDIENDKYINPIWSKNRIHNWQNYISDDMKKEWNNFTIYQRMIIGKNAEHQANLEEWD